MHHPTSGLLVLLQEGRCDDLRRMFQLFTRSGVALQEQPMVEVFEIFVDAEGAKALATRRAELAAEEAAGKKEVCWTQSSQREAFRKAAHR